MGQPLSEALERKRSEGWEERLAHERAIKVFKARFKPAQRSPVRVCIPAPSQESWEDLDHFFMDGRDYYHYFYDGYKTAHYWGDRKKRKDREWEGG